MNPKLKDIKSFIKYWRQELPTVYEKLRHPYQAFKLEEAQTKREAEIIARWQGFKKNKGLS